MSINGWIKKMWKKKRKCGVFVQWNIICLQTGKCKDTDGPGRHYSKWNKLVPEEWILILLTYGFHNSQTQKLTARRGTWAAGVWSIHSCFARWWGSRDFLCIAQRAVNNTVLFSCLCEDGRSVSLLATKKQSKQKWQRKTQQFLEVMNIFIIFIVVTVSGVCANVQAHQLVYFKYVECFMCLLDLNKAVKSPSWITACHGKGPCITQQSYEPCHAGPC